MGKVFILIVSILMPGREPDINHMQQMESADACWDAAKEYMSHDLTKEMRQRGAIGLRAGCAYQAPQENDN